LVLILKDNGREHITMRERTMYVKIWMISVSLLQISLSYQAC
jgi:hypothetical protein